MNKIFKYLIPCQEKFELQLPLCAKIIRVEAVDGLFYLWAIVEPENELVVRFFECYKTGQPILTPIEQLHMVGTCKLFIMQELCLYIFEVKS